MATTLVTDNTMKKAAKKGEDLSKTNATGYRDKDSGKMNFESTHVIEFPPFNNLTPILAPIALRKHDRVVVNADSGDVMRIERNDAVFWPAAEEKADDK